MCGKNQPGRSRDGLEWPEHREMEVVQADEVRDGQRPDHKSSSDQGKTLDSFLRVGNIERFKKRSDVT